MGGCQWGSIPTADPHQANHREALNHTHTQKQTLGARDIAQTLGVIFTFELYLQKHANTSL